MQHVLHNVEENNFKLRVFYNKAKDKNKETEERNNNWRKYAQNGSLKFK